MSAHTPGRTGRGFSAPHSPGPWKVIANLIYSSTFATASEGLTPIAKVNLPPRCRLPTGKYAANAALIAAAPDLLAACGEALRVLEDETRPQTTAREMLRAAIAKARGGR